MIGTARDGHLPHVEPILCHVCRRCLARSVCQVHAIYQFDLDEPPFIEPHRCLACLRCLDACPFGAITVPGSSPAAT